MIVAERSLIRDLDYSKLFPLELKTDVYVVYENLEAKTKI